MAGKFNSEVLAIQALRKKHPSKAQKTLARRIVDRSFFDAEDNAAATKAGTRPLLSVYSVIRRFDAKQPALAGAGN